jgi:flagellar biosynthesis protein FliR
VPIAATAAPAKMSGLGALVIMASGRILETALALAAPAVVALLLADLLLGAVCRIAPQVPVYFVGMPLKALAGVGIVLVALGGIEAALVTALRGWVSLLDAGVALWR